MDDADRLTDLLGDVTGKEIVNGKNRDNVVVRQPHILNVRPEIVSMIALDRLKGTDLLLHGFEEVLQSWLGVPPSDVREWDGEALEMFQTLPPFVREFYDCIDRWPSSKIVVDHNQDYLVIPPSPRTSWNSFTRESEVIDPKQILLVDENQSVVCVWISISDESYGTLFTDKDDDYNDGEFRMEASLEEFLITFGFWQLIINGGEEPMHNELFEKSSLVFSGRYFRDEPMSFRYHPEGFMWIVAYGDSSPYWCARKPMA